MRKSFWVGAFVVVALSIGFVLRAKTAPQSGYDAFTKARALAIWGEPTGEPSATEKLAPAENLRLQRLTVARNAPAMAQLRAALKLGIEAPPQNPGDVSIFRFSSAARQFARQFAQESAVRAADGDALGAAQSNLDALELGAQVGRGSLIQWLSGGAVSSIADAYLAKNAPLLNAEESRQVAAQLDTIEAQRPTFAQVLRDEEAVSSRGGKATLEDPKTRAKLEADLGKPEHDKDREFSYSNAEIRRMLAVTPAQFEANHHRLFEEAIARASQPYQIAVNATPLQGDGDYYSDLTAEVLNNPMSRFFYEGSALRSRLLSAALRLHAAKLETGAYPDQFDAGVDPFSPTLAPLIYRRAGDKYLLYSVGSDGVDDGGTNASGKNITEGLKPSSTGDMVAPVF